MLKHPVNSSDFFLLHLFLGNSWCRQSASAKCYLGTLSSSIQFLIPPRRSEWQVGLEAEKSDFLHISFSLWKRKKAELLKGTSVVHVQVKRVFVRAVKGNE